MGRILGDDGHSPFSDPSGRLDMALDAAGIGIWIFDLTQEKAHYRSPRYDTLFGYDEPQDLWNREMTERFIVPEDRDVLQEAITQALSSGVLRFELRIKRANEEIRWIAGDGRTAFAPDGTPLRISVVVRDVTAERGALQQYVRANALLDAIFEAAPVGLGAWDEQFRFLRVNARLAEINGLEPAAHINKRPDEILPDIAGLDAVYERWRTVLQTGNPWLNVEVRGATPAQPGVVRTWLEHFYPIRSGADIIGIGAVVEETTQKRQQDERLRLLLEEVNHRSKNMLAVVQMLVQQSARTSEERAFVARFADRLKSLADSQDLLVQSKWSGVCLHELIASQLSHYREFMGTRIQMQGPRVQLTAMAAQPLAMAFHELCTNSVKYGALSCPGGRIAIDWHLEEDVVLGSMLSMSWRETGVASVVTPEQHGFGHRVLTQMLQYALDAKVELNFAQDGIVWMLTAPAHIVMEPSGGAS